MVIYATEYEKRLIVQALRDYARNCPGGARNQAATLAAKVEQAYRPYGSRAMYRPFYNLRVRFAQCEMSQNEVARAAGMASSTMTARMTGAQPFDAWQMEAIAAALHIPPEEYSKYFFDRRKGA